MARLFRRGGPPPEAAAETTPGDAPARTFADIQPDPDRIGIFGSVPFVRLPAPARLFSERARRLKTLASGHPLEGYLDLLARIATAQADVVAQRAAVGERAVVPPAEDVALRTDNGMPPLSRSLLSDDPSFLASLDRLLAVIDLSSATEAAQFARDALRAAPSDERLELAVQVFEGAFLVERMAECVFVAAALQVFLAEQAAALDEKTLKPVAEGVCPCCGGAPTASLVVGWTPADKARYLSCSLCGTLWNHVRIRCTACGSGEGISYYGLDEASKDVQVETCTSCNSYLKHLHQHRDPALDPVADDVASYGLDLKIAEEGFRRAGLNLLFVF
ncbi:formate dehydrogenase accessory protein FdhE [Methylobacterium haplocladii]|uniref:Protein FdhE homolog n=1 Tax=Methylobacterium haplocladii TaxID=1176176 RepID=A0A512IU77_9HYPH|nr:formate dehydrogenase accessory protein FdhE [Methylobacterium haplocladii]GEP01260.1 protein FdhE [Methylobacterium haplocladii]GJD82158.1 Protein FdhE [Methylobacterium haplocladii]GLS60619.1 protein FdhE [Methylobacterium haplocladii]